MFDDLEDIDLDEFDDESLFDEDDDADEGKYKIWFRGYDESGREVENYQYLYGSYETQDSAEEAIEDFFYDSHYDIRDYFMIPDEVTTIEVIGEMYVDDLLSDNEVFYSRPLEISFYD